MSTLEYEQILAEMDRWYRCDSDHFAGDLIEHMRRWFREKKDEEDRINRASFFARYGPERPQ